MGQEAEIEEVTKTPEELAQEAEAKAAEEAKLAEEEKAKAETELREKMQAEGKTEEEIEEAVKKASETSEEVVISLKEDTQPQFTQEDVNDIVGKRVNKLNAKVEEVKHEKSEVDDQLALEQEKNKVLQLALEQAQASRPQEEEILPPNPADFDDGYSDPAYIAAHSEYTAKLVAKQVKEQVSQVVKKSEEETLVAQTDQVQTEKLQKKQRKHYENASSIGAKDYETTEDIALDILGNNIVNHIIDNFEEDSHVLLYYLGKNPDTAKQMKHLISSNPIRGVKELTRLSSNLQVTGKKSESANPDEEIKGDISSNPSEIERKLDALREEAARTGKMDKLIAFKKQHKL